MLTMRLGFLHQLEEQHENGAAEFQRELSCEGPFLHQLQWKAVQNGAEVWSQESQTPRFESQLRPFLAV